MNNSVHVSFLQSLLGRNLRIHTTDTRMFVGIFKCTDMDRNVILANTFEYRLPSQSALQAAAESASPSDAGKFKMDMTSRFIGVVVVPGQHITKIEVEENPFEIRTRPLPVTH
ncbi:hypothetical protein UA08_00110 [Talaromyces atroroseus]|uniref:Sm domain-containing protein n=1 Tax=Talaromyces atroroseus TaxID=1441469 RepID=A0A225ASM1_TALAT|nr:hypothetical protein UA08_00110 [Talaromyces atroroseus]OKL64601.1 hypothetical protein UA08_00110 [Talaromyces atroroseus]